MGIRLKVKIHKIHCLKSKSTCKIAKSNTGHEIHGNTAKAKYLNPSALAQLALASVDCGAWTRDAMGDDGSALLDYVYRSLALT